MKAITLLSSAALLLVQCTPLRYYERGGALHKEQQYHSDQYRYCFSPYTKPTQRKIKDQLAAIRDRADSVKIDVAFLNMGTPDNTISQSFILKRKHSWHSTLNALSKVNEWGVLVPEPYKKTGDLRFMPLPELQDSITLEFYDHAGNPIGEGIEYITSSNYYEKGSEGAVELTEELFTLEGLVEVKKIIDKYPRG